LKGVTWTSPLFSKNPCKNTTISVPAIPGLHQRPQSERRFERLDRRPIAGGEVTHIHLERKVSDFATNDWSRWSPKTLPPAGKPSRAVFFWGNLPTQSHGIIDDYH
jgi:hypothetical protein